MEKFLKQNMKSKDYKDSWHILNLGTTQGALEDFKQVQNMCRENFLFNLKLLVHIFV